LLAGALWYIITALKEEERLERYSVPSSRHAVNPDELRKAAVVEAVNEINSYVSCANVKIDVQQLPDGHITECHIFTVRESGDAEITPEESLWLFR
jgi:hypothetical protein